MRTYIKRICAYIVCFSLATTALSTLSYQDVGLVDDEGASVCQSCVFAATDDENSALLETVQSLEWVLKALYLLMRPLLAIAGASLDNALVYGEIFFLDTMLWKFRQVIRNFTNFAIGLVFVGSILMSFFYQNSEKFSLPKILRNTFIAGIVVQMSWFLIAVLLDISTIGVLGLGALPLNILGQSSDHVLNNVRYLKPHTLYNIDGTKEELRDYAEHSVLYSCQDNATTRYLACWVDQGKFLPKGEVTDPKTREAYKHNVAEIRKNVGGTDIEESNISDNYCVRGLDLLILKGGTREAETNGDVTIPSVTVPPLFGEQLSPDIVNKARRVAAGTGQDMSYCSTLDKYVEKAAGLTGPLYVLFAVVMDMSEIAVTGTNVGVTEAVFIFMIRVIIGLALLIPLFALCVVLIIRVVILWLIIAFSPVLSLLFIYGKTSEDTKVLGGNLTSVTDIMTLIFLPVVVVFAISMSLVFLSLITRIDFIKNETSCAEDPLSLMGCELNKEKCDDNSGGNREYDCFGVKIILTESESNNGANIINTMGWLVQSFMGIAIMRAIIFMALKSSKITAGVASSIEGFGKTLAMAAPVIPTGSGWMSMGGAQKTLEQAGRIPEMMQQKQYENSPMKDFLDAQLADFGGSAKEVNEKLAGATTQEAAVNNIKTLKAEENTNIRDYEQQLARNLSLAANTGKEYSSVEEALKDEQVANMLTQHGVASDFVQRWHKTGKYQNDGGKYERALAAGMGIGKHTVPGVKSDTTALNLHHLAHTDGNHYYYELEGSGVDIRISKEDPYTFSDTISSNMSETGIGTLSRMIQSYGGVAAVPESIWNHFGGKDPTSLYQTLIDADPKATELSYEYTPATGDKKTLVLEGGNSGIGSGFSLKKDKSATNTGTTQAPQ